MATVMNRKVCILGTALLLLISCQKAPAKLYVDAINDCEVPNSILAGTSCMIGAAIPSFSAIDLQGRVITSEDLNTPYTLINFWYIECPPCIEELPLLSQFQEEIEGLEILSFCLNSKEELLIFLEQHSIPFRIVPDAEQIIKEVFLSKWGYPINFLVNRHGVIEAVYKQLVEGSSKAEELASKVQS